MYEIKECNNSNRTAILSFMERCLPESGRVFELDGRHYAYKDIEKNFLKFWCMYDGDDIIGTVAIRDIGQRRGEIKSLYLLNDYQGKGFGRKLFDLALTEVKRAGFNEVYLDTIRANSKRALDMYKKAGFVEIEKYNDNPVADVFMKLVIIDITFVTKYINPPVDKIRFII